MIDIWLNDMTNRSLFSLTYLESLIKNDNLSSEYFDNFYQHLKNIPDSRLFEACGSSLLKARDSGNKTELIKNANRVADILAIYVKKFLEEELANVEAKSKVLPEDVRLSVALNWLRLAIKDLGIRVSNSKLSLVL